MAVLDLLLSLAALMLWLSWRGIGAEQASGPAGTLLANLRPAHRSQAGRHGNLVGLVAILIGRAILYRQFGPSFDWHPSWSPGAVTVVFRSDHFLLMLGSSLLGFGWVLFGLVTFAFLVAAIHRAPQDKDAVTREVRRRLGWLASLPAVILLLLPMLMLGLLWLVLGWVAARLGLVPALHGSHHLFQQAVVVGFGAVLVWKWPLTIVLGLYFVNSYVFFGASPVWDFIQQTGARLCRPLAFLRFGRLNLSPLVLLVAIWGVAGALGSGLPWLKASMRGVPPWLESGALPMLYRSLPW